MNQIESDFIDSYPVNGSNDEKEKFHQELLVVFSNDQETLNYYLSLWFDPKLNQELVKVSTEKANKVIIPNYLLV